MNGLPIVFAAPEAALLYAGHYDHVLVALSVGLAIFASYAALLVSQQVERAATGTLRRVWIAAGGLCMGAGIWAMHFVGMLAFSLPCTTTYDATITLLSMIPGIMASMLAMTLISRPAISALQLTAGGVLLGAGIGAMHYSGMAAYRLDGLIRYDAKLFAVSILVAVALAILAIWIKFRVRAWRGRAAAPAIAAVVMGLAVSGMHYTAMAAAHFIRGEGGGAVDSGLAPTFLASIVLIVTSAIIVVTLLAMFLDRPHIRSLSRIYRLASIPVLAWAALAWLSSSYYSAHMAERAYRDGLAQARERADGVAGDINDALATMRGIPKVLAEADVVRQQLERFGPAVRPAAADYESRKRAWSGDAGLARLDRFLAAAASGLNADAIWMTNAAGDCVAASNAGQPASFVGANFSEREYFRQAQAGQAGRQYALGKVSKIPGLYYSYPVQDAGGRFLGALVAKRDLSHFLRWTAPAGAFLADADAGATPGKASRRWICAPGAKTATANCSCSTASRCRSSWQPARSPTGASPSTPRCRCPTWCASRPSAPGCSSSSPLPAACCWSPPWPWCSTCAPTARRGMPPRAPIAPSPSFWPT